MARQGMTKYWVTLEGLKQLRDGSIPLSREEMVILSDLVTSNKGLTPGIIARDIGWETSEYGPSATEMTKDGLEKLESLGLATKDRQLGSRVAIGSTRPYTLPNIQDIEPNRLAGPYSAGPEDIMPWEWESN